jgi:hypothetical protein
MGMNTSLRVWYIRKGKPVEMGSIEHVSFNFVPPVNIFITPEHVSFSFVAPVNIFTTSDEIQATLTCDELRVTKFDGALSTRR